MGTLEGALESVLGYHIVHDGKADDIEFECIPEPRTLEEATGHALRELMVAHAQQRAYLKRTVSDSSAASLQAHHSTSYLASALVFLP